MDYSEKRGPHAASVNQQLRPHAATVLQLKEPHPATVIQRKGTEAQTRLGVKEPHPATVAKSWGPNVKIAARRVLQPVDVANAPIPVVYRCFVPDPSATGRVVVVQSAAASAWDKPLKLVPETKEQEQKRRAEEAARARAAAAAAEAKQRDEALRARANLARHLEQYVPKDNQHTVAALAGADGTVLYCEESSVWKLGIGEPDILATVKRSTAEFDLEANKHGTACGEIGCLYRYAIARRAADAKSEALTAPKYSLALDFLTWKWKPACDGCAPPLKWYGITDVCWIA